MEKYYVNMITGERSPDRPDSATLGMMGGIEAFPNGSITVCPVVIVEEEGFTLECADDKDVSSINFNAIVNNGTEIEVATLDKALDDAAVFVRSLDSSLKLTRTWSVDGKDLLICMVLPDYSKCPFLDSESILDKLFEIISEGIVRRKK